MPEVVLKPVLWKQELQLPVPTQRGLQAWDHLSLRRTKNKNRRIFLKLDPVAKSLKCKSRRKSRMLRAAAPGKGEKLSGVVDHLFRRPC